MNNTTEQAPRGTALNPFLYTGTDAEIERFFLLGMFVAGKTATVQEAKLTKFTNSLTASLTAAVKLSGASAHTKSQAGVLTTLGLAHTGIARLHTNHAAKKADVALERVVRRELCKNMTGQYERLTAGIVKAATEIRRGTLDLRTAPRTKLCTIPGVGPKTASFFLMYTRQNIRVACLDTHVLAWLRDHGHPKAPGTSPQSPAAYERWERIFLQECDTRGVDPAKFDFDIWSSRARI